MCRYVHVHLILVRKRLGQYVPAATNVHSVYDDGDLIHVLQHRYQRRTILTQ
jgi:hypothetical protein